MAKKMKKRKAVVKVSKKITAIKDKQTKNQIIAHIAEEMEIEKKAVRAVFEGLDRLVQAHMMTRGSGEITIPEVGAKIRRVKKKATKARKGRNPFTGEEIMIKAKPARNVIRVSALRRLKALSET